MTHSWKLTLCVAAALSATAISAPAYAGLQEGNPETPPPSLSVPPWLVIGLYEGTIPESAISGFGYGDFDWATMSPGERLRLYDAAMQEAQVNS